MNFHFAEFQGSTCAPAHDRLQSFSAQDEHKVLRVLN